jgi:hypothetical protein
MNNAANVTRAVPSMLPKPEEMLVLALIVGGITLTEKERNLAYEIIETEIAKGTSASAAEEIRTDHPGGSVARDGDIQTVLHY